MQKLPARGSLAKYNHAREVKPGFPWEGKFASIKEVEAYVSGEDGICCLMCGKTYRSLGRHIKSVHQVDADDYRVRFNIPHRFGLDCASMREKRSANANAEHFGTRRNAARPNPARKSQHWVDFQQRAQSERLKSLSSTAGIASREVTEKISKLFPDVLSLVENGSSIASACRTVGLGRTTLKRYLKANPNCRQLMDRAKQ